MRWVSAEAQMITVRKLAQAIERHLSHPPEQAEEEARTVLNYFGFQDTIIDNRIEPEDRKLFYALHDVGLLQSSWETVHLLDGRHWRIFYWRLDEDAIEHFAGAAEERHDEQVYRNLPEEAWAHPPTSA